MMKQLMIICLFLVSLTAASEFDPINVLETHRSSKSAVFDQAVSLLRSFEHSSSCYRTAAQFLVNSCQRLDSRKGEILGDELVYYRYNYAIGLAVCDLSIAKKSMTSSCDNFRESSLKSLTTFENGKHIQVARDITDDCMEALSKDAVLWNSFNSNKAQAMTICQASREDMEKDEILSTYRATGKVVENFNELLNLYTEEWRIENQRREIANNKLFQTIFIQLSTVKEDLSGLAAAFLNDFRAPVKSAEDAMTAISIKGSEVEALFSILRDDIRKVHEEHVLAQAANDDMKSSVVAMNSEIDKLGSFIDQISLQFTTIEAKSMQAQENADITNKAVKVLQTQIVNVTEGMAFINDMTQDHRDHLTQFAAILVGINEDASSLKLSLLNSGISGIIMARLLGVPWWMFIIATPLTIIIGFTFCKVSLQRLFRFTGIGLLAPIAIVYASRAIALVCDLWLAHTESPIHTIVIDFIGVKGDILEKHVIHLALSFAALSVLWMARYSCRKVRRNRIGRETTDEELTTPYIKLEPEF